MKDKRIEKLIDRRNEINSELRKIEFELFIIVRNYIHKGNIKVYNIEHIKMGSWDCENSPIGICVYDDIEDPYYDNCIFCQEPHERK